MTSDSDYFVTRRWNSNILRSGLHDAESLVASGVKSLWSGFIDFALQENVLQVAVGVTIATAFTKLVNSLVTDILLPPISLLPWMDRNLSEKFMVLRVGEEHSTLGGYNTREQALADGALIWTYGSFLDELLSFMGIGLALYIVANLYGRLTKDPIIQHVVKCPYCSKPVSAKAKRCFLCTSWLDGREDAETSALPVNRVSAES